MFARLGEQTGQLPAMLQRAANQLGAEVQRRAMQLATILEPLLIVAMGLVVMLIVLAVLLPIIQLNQFARCAVTRRWPSRSTTSWWSRSPRAPCSISRKRTRSSRAATRKAYMKLQLERLDLPARPGIAFSLIKKLLAFNDTTAQRVEVVILSRNDPVSGMRIFRSGHANEIKLERGVFTQGRSPFRYLRPLRAHLFLSANAEDVREALAAGFPAARVLTESVLAGSNYPNEVRIAFDGDAVLFSDEAEQVFQAQGLDAFQQHELEQGRRSRCPKAPSSRCWRRCTGCSRPARRRCGSAPRW